jgi:hypothetical protein
MTDNFVANPGSGGDTFAADDVGGVKYPASKIDAGGDGVSVPIIAGQKTMSASLPIAIASDQTALPASQSGSWTVTANAGSGTFNISASSLPLPTGAATQATLASVLTALATLPSGTNTIGAVLNAMPARTTGTITANGQSVTCTLAGAGGGVIAYSGTFSGINATFQASYDGGTNYINHIVAPIAGTGPVSSLAGVSTGTAAFIFYAPGATNFRINCTAYTSGTMNVTINPLAISVPGVIASKVSGFDASNASFTANPVAAAIAARSTEPGANTNGTVVVPQGTQTGKLVALPFAIANVTWTYAAAAGGLVTTAGVTVKAAGAAGIRNYVTHIDVVNSHATQGTDIQIRDGASGTVLWRGYAAPAGGGISADFNPPLRGSAATLVEIAEGTATGTTGVYCNLSGYTSVE